MSRRILGALVVLECLVCLPLIGMRVSRPAAPTLNLERMNALTAADLETLRHAADNGGAIAWSAYGQACLANGYLLEAEAVLEQALRLNPDDQNSRWFLARTREKLGDPDAAIAEYRRILSVPATGREAICWYRIGRNHLRADRLADAEEAFRRAGPYPAAQVEQARIRLRSGDLPEAAKHLQELQNQTIPDVYVEMLAVELARLRQNPLELAKALERLERSEGVLESQREWQDVEAIRSLLGWERRLAEIAQLRSKHPPTALAAFRELHAATPPEFTDPFSPVVMQMALQAHDIPALDALKDHYERRLAMPPMALHYVAQAYWEGRDEKRVEPASRRADSLFPVTETSQHLAQFAAFRHHAEEERKSTARALAVDGTTRYRLREMDRASDLLQQAVGIDPEAADAWFYLGEIELARGDLDRARIAYQQCLAANPRFGRASERLNALP